MNKKDLTIAINCEVFNDFISTIYASAYASIPIQLQIKFLSP